MRWWIALFCVLAAAWWWVSTRPASPPPVEAPVGATVPAPPVSAPPAAPVAVPVPAAAVEKITAEPEEPLERLVDQLTACELWNHPRVRSAKPYELFRLLERRVPRLASDDHVTRVTLLNLAAARGQDDVAKAQRTLSLSEDLPSQLLYALLAADLLEGWPNPAPRYADAVRTLRSLQAKWPGNAAIPLFLAAALARSGKAREAELRLALEAAARAPELDTLIPRMRRLLWDTGLQEPKAFVLANELLRRVPEPNFSPGLQLLRERARKEDPDAAHVAYAFAGRFTAQGRSEKEHAPGVYWSSAQYDLGRELARDAWKVMAPERSAEELDERFPPLWKLPSAAHPRLTDQPGFPPFYSDRKTCDTSRFQQLLNQEAGVGAR